MTDIRKWIKIVEDNSFRGSVSGEENVPDASTIQLNADQADFEKLNELANRLLIDVRMAVESLASAPLKELVNVAESLLGKEHPVIQEIMRELVVPATISDQDTKLEIEK